MTKLELAGYPPIRKTPIYMGLLRKTDKIDEILFLSKVFNLVYYRTIDGLSTIVTINDREYGMCTSLDISRASKYGIPIDASKQQRIIKELKKKNYIKVEKVDGIRHIAINPGLIVAIDEGLTYVNIDQ